MNLGSDSVYGRLPLLVWAPDTNSTKELIKWWRTDIDPLQVLHDTP